MVAREDELEIDQMKLVRLGERRIVLVRTEHGGEFAHLQPMPPAPREVSFGRPLVGG